MDYVMRRRSTVGGALEMFSLPLPLPLPVLEVPVLEVQVHVPRTTRPSTCCQENYLLNKKAYEMHILKYFLDFLSD